jgi:DNA-binding transcriptional ArsR family regulator
VSGSGSWDEFDEAAVFHALDDAGRRAMVTRLSIAPATVSEIVPSSMTLAAGVQHVQVLEKSGLICTEKLGRKRICRLNPDTFKAAEAWLASRRSPIERRLEQLDDHLLSRKDNR